MIMRVKIEKSKSEATPKSWIILLILLDILIESRRKSRFCDAAIAVLSPALMWR